MTSTCAIVNSYSEFYILSMVNILTENNFDTDAVYIPTAVIYNWPTKYAVNSKNSLLLAELSNDTQILLTTLEDLGKPDSTQKFTESMYTENIALINTQFKGIQNGEARFKEAHELLLSTIQWHYICTARERRKLLLSTRQAILVSVSEKEDQNERHAVVTENTLMLIRRHLLLAEKNAETFVPKSANAPRQRTWVNTSNTYIKPRDFNVEIRHVAQNRRSKPDFGFDVRFTGDIGDIGIRNYMSPQRDTSCENLGTWANCIYFELLNNPYFVMNIREILKAKVFIICDCASHTHESVKSDSVSDADVRTFSTVCPAYMLLAICKNPHLQRSFMEGKRYPQNQQRADSALARQPVPEPLLQWTSTSHYDHLISLFTQQCVLIPSICYTIARSSPTRSSPRQAEIETLSLRLDIDFNLLQALYINEQHRLARTRRPPGNAHLTIKSNEQMYSAFDKQRHRRNKYVEFATTPYWNDFHKLMLSPINDEQRKACQKEFDGIYSHLTNQTNVWKTTEPYKDGEKEIVKEIMKAHAVPFIAQLIEIYSTRLRYSLYMLLRYTNKYEPNGEDVDKAITFYTDSDTTESTERNFKGLNETILLPKGYENSAKKSG